MAIKNDQIDMEIDELLSVERSLQASIRNDFARLGKILIQIALLRRLRELRSDPAGEFNSKSYVLLGLAISEEREPQPFCVVAWSGEPLAPIEMRLFVRADWTTLASSYLVPYVTELIEDWKEMMKSQPEVFVALVSDLSVGPVRTMQCATAPAEQIKPFVISILGSALQFPPDIVPIH